VHEETISEAIPLKSADGIQTEEVIPFLFPLLFQQSMQQRAQACCSFLLAYCQIKFDHWVGFFLKPK